MKVTFQDADTHLVAVCEGKWEPDAVAEAVGSIKEEALRSSHRRILVYWLGVSPPPTERHRFLAGEAVAEMLPHPFKLAVLGKEALINKLGENTARNRGASVHVCSDEKEALTWLLADGQL